jgi:hypothetical protein
MNSVIDSELSDSPPVILSNSDRNIAWLHLSDLHNCKARTGWDAHRVLQPLIPDFKKMEQDHGLVPQLLFFTGDAAFGNIGSISGSTLKEQFDGAQELIETARTAFSVPIPKENVFIVPGNHDVNRDEVTPDQTAWLATQSSSVVNDLIKKGGKQWQRFMDRLADYREFLTRHGYDHLLSDATRLVFSEIRELNGTKVGITGFNSAWSCSAEDKKGNLWFGGDWQSGELSHKPGKIDFSIALIHHPFGWFVEQEDTRLRIRFEREFALHLHGHEHLGWVDVKEEGHVRIATGACYDKSDLENGYNFVRLDLVKGRGEVWLRKYDAEGGGWVPRVIASKTDNDGLRRLDKLPWLQALVQIDSPGHARGENSIGPEALITSLLPEELSKTFTYGEFAAWTEDDIAGISLIASLIQNKAEKGIRVIGRGTQIVEAKTRPYVTAVAKAVLRGVSYTRILIIDPALPQNALFWLLFLERFLSSPKWRDSVNLYTNRSEVTNKMQQFQIVDDKFFHRIVRRYSEGKAAPRSESTFLVSPHREIDQYSRIYGDHLHDAKGRYKHKDVFDLLTTLLHSLDRKNQSISYHWQLALDVVAFLDSIDVQGLPRSRIKFVGCLMPFTFTYDAAERFARRVNESFEECVIALPFRRMSNAIEQFLAKRLSYICLPVENSRIDHLVPPTANEASLAAVRDGSRKIDEIELLVSFVLAGVYKKPTPWKRLAAVDAAYMQVSAQLPKNAARLTRGSDDVESNYHAAWLARHDPSVIAITTPQAAAFLELHIYKELCKPSEQNRTKFAVYGY